VTLAILLVATWALYVVTSRGAIMNDDIEHLRFAQESGLTWEYLFTPVFDHFAPGHRLLVLLQLEIGALRFDVMFAVIVGMVALSALVATDVLTKLYGARRWIPIIAAIIVVNPFTVDVSGWFASAFHQVPALFLGMIAVDGFVTYRLSKRPGWLALSVIAFVVGMLFVSKILLYFGALVLLDHLLLRDEPLASLPRGASRDWPMWAAYVIPVLVYLTLAAQTIDERPVGNASDIVAGARIIWLTRFVPTLFGLSVNANPDGTLSGDALAVTIAAQVLFAVLVGYLIHRRRSAIKAVVIVLAVFVVNAVMTLTTRVSLYGPAVGLELYRYWLNRS
jgi:hypothetical protein